MWLPSTSSGSSSLDKSSLTLTCMELVYISFSNTNSQKECFRLTVQLCILYIGCEVQPRRRALPSAWDCRGRGDPAPSRCPMAQGWRGQEFPSCHPRAGVEGRAGYQPLLCFMGLQRWWQQAQSHRIPGPLQHPCFPGCSKGFPSNMGMLAWL